MSNILSSVLENLFGIVVSILTSIEKDLLFPLQPRSLEEQFFSKMRGQSSLISGQQNRLIYQTGVIADQNRGIRDRDDLLTQKDKEIRNLVETNRSLEFQLQEASRYKRWR